MSHKVHTLIPLKEGEDYRYNNFANQDEQVS